MMPENQQHADTFEVLVRWESAVIGALDDQQELFGYVRVAGEPGDDSSTTRVEMFTPRD